MLKRPDMIIQNAAQILPCTGDNMQDFQVLTDQAVVIDGQKIIDICSHQQLVQRYVVDNNNSIDASGKVVAPGYIDAHTHLVFHGSRVEEYAAKLTGDIADNLKKLAITTGPNRTIELTRDTSEEELFKQAKKRIMTMLKHGTTTVESKSGYGLTLESELKILRVGRRLNDQTAIDVVNTFLGAHGIPDHLTKEQYVNEIVDVMIPQVAQHHLAEFCDVWCDEGYFTDFESERILQAGLAHGLLPKIHADAYSYIGGSDLAARMKMISIDHLNYTPETVMAQLAQEGVVGVLMPALDFAVAHNKPFDARKMLDNGMHIALATDMCPACYTTSMSFVINLACRLYQFSVEEAIKAATKMAAKALNLTDRGTLEIGKMADIQIWDVPNYKHVAYELGTNIVDTVIKRGQVVISKGSWAMESTFS
ncbi:imidazolonepropionase [Lysinibacillus sp. NPDC093712]|uniref:imidazolonepropionase n=1 Tax=Lysinibacillus sp. NPDC093712 TaxID=3390579 RepID=UPI003D02EFA2